MRENLEVSVTTTKGVLAEVGLRSVNDAESHSLADSGFGYSQVLPILTRGLLTPPGHTLIVEQPELHLNPSLQVRLVEFLVSLAALGKQVVVETHSEHIVNAMRVLTAENDSLPDSKVLFLELEEGRPRITGLEVAEDGTVKDWPVGFFGEAASLRGRLLKAQRRFVKQEGR